MMQIGDESRKIYCNKGRDLKSISEEIKLVREITKFALEKSLKILIEQMSMKR